MRILGRPLRILREPLRTLRILGEPLRILWFGPVIT
jgi:hypothetical protein